MPQGVWDYLPEYDNERTDILDAVDTVFSSGQLVLGESVRKFEQEFAAYHGHTHGVGLDNGTNAIALGLRALGVGPGDEVITVANTAAPTVVAIDAIGATPVFVDVRADDFLMDTTQIPDVVTSRTKALLPVHLYGQCMDMVGLGRIATHHNLAVLEDCAQAHGARQDGEIAGSMGDAAAFSFYPTKVLGAYGDAGATLTSRSEVDDELRRLRFYGMAGHYYTVQTPAHNSRLDEVHAEILRRKLGRLESYIAGRRTLARRYEEALSDTELVLPCTAAGNEHVYYLYVVRHPRRDEIIDALRSYGINLSVSYPWPVHTMSGFAHLGYACGDLPVTEALSHQVFSLPMYPSLPTERQDTVISALREVLAAR